MLLAVCRWWNGGRGKHTARLFAFEFFVVVAGVLAAQGLANWVATRAERDLGRRLFADATESARQLDLDVGAASVADRSRARRQSKPTASCSG